MADFVSRPLVSSMPQEGQHKSHRPRHAPDTRPKRKSDTLRIEHPPLGGDTSLRDALRKVAPGAKTPALGESPSELKEALQKVAPASAQLRPESPVLKNETKEVSPEDLRAMLRVEDITDGNTGNR